VSDLGRLMRRLHRDLYCQGVRDYRTGNMNTFEAVSWLELRSRAVRQDRDRAPALTYDQWRREHIACSLIADLRL
jgi:hypothetical protein